MKTSNDVTLGKVILYTLYCIKSIIKHFYNETFALFERVRLNVYI